MFGEKTFLLSFTILTLMDEIVTLFSLCFLFSDFLLFPIQIFEHIKQCDNESFVIKSENRKRGLN